MKYTKEHLIIFDKIFKFYYDYCISKVEKRNPTDTLFSKMFNIDIDTAQFCDNEVLLNGQYLGLLKSKKMGYGKVHLISMEKIPTENFIDKGGFEIYFGNSILPKQTDIISENTNYKIDLNKWMYNKIEKLKNLAEKIRLAKFGKRGKEEHVNSHIVIEEYHEWRTESEALFCEFFDNSNKQFKEFAYLPKDGNGSVLMGYFNQQYPIFKILIEKIENGEAIKSKEKIEPIPDIMGGKFVFISHASKDKEIVDAFVDLILHGSLSVPIDKIFCVSTDGTKIKSGADWRESINKGLLSAKINFLIITPNYKESEVCLNEMGAAWMTSAKILPLIVEPINYKTVGIIQEPNQIEKILDEKSLDRIKDIIQETLVIQPTLIKSDRWSNKKHEFINKVRNYLENNPFQVPIDREHFHKLIKDSSALKIANENHVRKISELKEIIKKIRSD